MNDRRYFVIRQEYEVPATASKLRDEVKAGRVRQGWGISGLDLRKPLEEWVISFIKGWETKRPDGTEVGPERTDAQKRFGILRRLLEVKAGDRIIVPKQPDLRHCLIATAVESNGTAYRFDDDPQKDRGELKDDFRHVIPVDPESVRQVAYTGSLNQELLSRKMRAFQSAVNNVLDQDFKEAVEQSLASHPIDQSATLDDVIRSDAIQPVIPGVLRSLQRSLAPNRLEELIERLFVRQGFDVTRRNFFNGLGGDVDRIFTIELSVPQIVTEFCPNFSSALVLHVQVKQKTGIDTNDVNDLQQLIKMRPEAPTLLQRDIFVSTADDFTDACQDLARSENIALVNGHQLARMVMRLL